VNVVCPFVPLTYALLSAQRSSLCHVSYSDGMVAGVDRFSRLGTVVNCPLDRPSSRSGDPPRRTGWTLQQSRNANDGRRTDFVLAYVGYITARGSDQPVCLAGVGYDTRFRLYWLC